MRKSSTGARKLEVRYLYKDYAPQCISIDDMAAETRRKTWIEIINRLMKLIGYTLQEAMNFLEISTEERPLIHEKLRDCANEIGDENAKRKMIFSIIYY